ncbi:hypothetical protein KAX02_00375 [candidate division WOR-3 bacterium]|nr:hypothetical protein [candidate division WOR-3 bacterium]
MPDLSWKWLEMKDIEEEIKKLYLKLQNEAGFKIGDKVKVMRKAESYESGWDEIWLPYKKDRYVGKIFPITNISDGGISLRYDENEPYSWHFPYFILEKVEEQTYHLGQHFLHDGETYVLCIPNYNEIGLINIESGCRWGDNTKVKNVNKITCEEMKKHTSLWFTFELAEE